MDVRDPEERKNTERVADRRQTADKQLTFRTARLCTNLDRDLKSTFKIMITSKNKIK